MSSWDARYVEGDTPWDLGQPSATVMRMAERALTGPSRVLVPGCGRGWDVEALARRGHAVTALDLSPTALAMLRDRIGDRLPVTTRVGDLLEPTAADQAELDGTFDGVVEHTCFCALDRERWPTYVERVAALLGPGGVLFGAFLDFEGTRPTGTNAAELEALFGGRFALEVLESAPEWFAPRGVPQLQAVFRRR